MAPDSMVVEDGLDETRAQPRARSGWSLVAVGFALGLALGIFMASPLDREITGEVAEDSPTEESSETPASALDSGISEVVPGFPDALVAIGDGPGGGLDHMLWPVGGPLITRTMTSGELLRIDTSGKFFAMSDRVPGLGGVLLSMGRFTDVRPVQTRVTSYTWHDSESGLLAYTTEGEEGWRLHQITPLFAPEVVSAPEYEGGILAAWGDWGYAIQAGDEVALLTPKGQFKDVEEGVAIASHSSGWILVAGNGLKLVSAGGGVRVLDLPLVPAPVVGAAFSPDGGHVAVAKHSGVTVYDLGVGDDTLLPGYPGRSLAWSSDSRFVFSPAPRGIAIYDLETKETYRVLVGHDVVVAGALPLSTS